MVDLGAAIHALGLVQATTWIEDHCPSPQDILEVTGGNENTGLGAWVGRQRTLHPDKYLHDFEK